MFERDEHGVLHIIGLSGGHDSTIMSILLKEQEPRPYNYVCTPTGDELPEMFNHWNLLGETLGKKIYPIMNGTLKSIIEDQGMLPNHRARFCTRLAKIIPYRAFLMQQAALGPVVSYVGLRFDEPGRAGGAYDDIAGVQMRFPLREWQYTDPMVLQALADRGINVPWRTDCARCFHQKIGEWWELWLYHPDIYADAEMDEFKYGHTYRTPGRDSWPTSLADLRKEFENGKVPERSLTRMYEERMIGACRVCML